MAIAKKSQDMDRGRPPQVASPCATKRPASQSNIGPIADLPDWVPAAVRIYLSHTEAGQSLRAIARDEGVHASTIMRTVRRFENRRDDVLVDQALSRLSARDAALGTDAEISKEAQRVFPYLTRTQSALIVAPDLDKAVILLEGPQGAERLAVLDRPMAEAFALREWLHCTFAGRVSRYVLSAAGRAVLHGGGAGAASSRDPDDTRGTRPITQETPVSILARRLDGAGAPFLSSALVAAADQLFEAFQVSGLSADELLDWPSLDAKTDGRNAMQRRAVVLLSQVLGVLGEGLADIAVRCCCLRQGVETAERDLGWAARSGKIVLRIALTQLAPALEARGDSGKMIG